MKKKLLAFVCAMTMVLGMGMNVCAANSPTSSVTAGDVVNKATTSAQTTASEELVGADENAVGQVITTATLGYFAETTTVSGVQEQP